RRKSTSTLAESTMTLATSATARARSRSIGLSLSFSAASASNRCVRRSSMVLGILGPLSNLTVECAQQLRRQCDGLGQPVDRVARHQHRPADTRQVVETDIGLVAVA